MENFCEMSMLNIIQACKNDSLNTKVVNFSRITTKNLCIEFGANMSGHPGLKLQIYSFRENRQKVIGNDKSHSL